MKGDGVWCRWEREPEREEGLFFPLGKGFVLALGPPPTPPPSSVLLLSGGKGAGWAVFPRLPSQPVQLLGGGAGGRPEVEEGRGLGISPLTLCFRLGVQQPLPHLWASGPTGGACRGLSFLRYQQDLASASLTFCFGPSSLRVVVASCSCSPLGASHGPFGFLALHSSASPLATIKIPLF